MKHFSLNHDKDCLFIGIALMIVAIYLIHQAIIGGVL